MIVPPVTCRVGCDALNRSSIWWPDHRLPWARVPRTNIYCGAISGHMPSKPTNKMHRIDGEQSAMGHLSGEACTSVVAAKCALLRSFAVHITDRYSMTVVSASPSLMVLLWSSLSPDTARATVVPSSCRHVQSRKHGEDHSWQRPSIRVDEAWLLLRVRSQPCRCHATSTGLYMMATMAATAQKSVLPLVPLFIVFIVEIPPQKSIVPARILQDEDWSRIRLARRR